MKIRSLNIRNFRAIADLAIADLQDVVVLAGPNGCGKSCVLDALRFLKSAHGGYQRNEIAMWFSEFQMNSADPRSLDSFFRDPSRPVHIEATIELSNEESEYLLANAQKVVEVLVWQDVLGTRFDDYYYGNQGMLSTTMPNEYATVLAMLPERAKQLATSANSALHKISATMQPGGQVVVHDQSPALRVVFSQYEPDSLGIFDFHTASRAYSREVVSNINLSMTQQSDQRRNWALYNWQQKYQNVKSELAISYVRELLRADSMRGAKFSSATAAETTPSDAAPADVVPSSIVGAKGLDEALKELFERFFPDKRYLGVRPGRTADFEFPVELADGSVHDINELSSGEKEILYGYLRLRSASPNHSVILLDEPELHLNPALLRELPDFYHENLGRAKDSQIWMVTHSDALLRASVGNPSFSVFHMSAATVRPEGNQVTEVLANDELEAATLALVGDMAAYVPNAKVAIFEGGGDSHFDVQMVTRLFPDFARRVNCVSGGDKKAVQNLYGLLEEAAARAGFEGKFFAVNDGDADVLRGNLVSPAGAHTKRWPVYHIENFLLEPVIIDDALKSVRGSSPFAGDLVGLEAALRECAKEIIPELVMEFLRAETNSRILGSVSLGGKPGADNPVSVLAASLAGTWERLATLQAELDRDYLESLADKEARRLRAIVDGPEWLARIPGRQILNRFVNKYVQKVPASAFKNILLDKMAQSAIRPAGMSGLLSEIAGYPIVGRLETVPAQAHDATHDPVRPGRP